MKVKCIDNKKKYLAEAASPENLKRGSDLLYENLIIGREYNVYGMIVNHGQICYYISDREYCHFPVARPANLFIIIDHRLSRYWIFGTIEAFENYPLWIFPEWLNEPYFQDNLTDYEEREVKIFKSYKELMDLEFPDSSIIEVAQIGDNEWLICPMCNDAWRYNNIMHALVKCPNCLKILNNPRYKNEYPHL